MPATYTHHIFGEDVFKVVNKNVQDNLKDSLDTFYLFGKSFDIFYFTKSNLGYLGHHKNVNMYFQNIIKFIKENNLTNCSDVLAYLYGSICHYVLDSTFHPYIFYNTGKFSVNNKKSYKYKGKHNYFEYMIDAIFYKNRKRKPIYKARLANEIFENFKFSHELTQAIDYAFENTFEVKNASKILNKGRKNFKFMMKYGMESHFGFKYFLYKIIDKLNIVKTKKLQCCCYYIKKLDESVLNLEHNKWYYPVDKKTSYHYSVYDLYDLSIEKARKIINLLDESLNKDDKTLEKAIKEIGDLDYSTGKKWYKKYKKLSFLY